MPMRVAFISATGSRMMVDESRIEEYKAAGYKLTADTPSEVHEVAEDKPVSRKRKKKED